MHLDLTMLSFGGVTFLALALLAILVRVFRLRATLEGQLVAERRIPHQFAGVWMAVGFTWATTLFFSGKLAYTEGWAGFAWYAAGNAGGLLLAMLVARRMPRPEAKYTLPQFIGERYGSSVALVYSLSLMGMQALYALTLQFLAAASLVAVIARVEGFEGWQSTREATIYAAALAMLMPVIIGGMRSSVALDLIKGSMMIALIAALVPLTVSRAGGAAALVGGIAAIDPGAGNISLWVLGGSSGLPLFLSLLCGGPLDQTLWQRWFSTKRRRGAAVKPWLLLGVAFFTLNMLAGASLGFLAGDRALGIAVTSPLTAGFDAMAHYLPLGAVFFSLATIAAFAGSGDAALNASSSIFAMDLYKKWVRGDAGERELKLVQRAIMIVFIVIAAGIAMQGVSMLGLVVAVGAVRAALIVPLLAATFERRRLPGALFPVLVAMAAAAALYALGNSLTGASAGYCLLAGSLAGIGITGAWWVLARRRVPDAKKIAAAA